MNGLARCALAGALTLALLSPKQANAQPSLWQRAAAPQTARIERSLVRIERVLDHVEQAEDDADMMQDFRLGALAVAELTGARELGDPRLLLLLSRALLDANLGREGEAVEMLERALEVTPPERVDLEAAIRPLLASALHEDPERAGREITRALLLVWEPGVRSLLLRRRAEAKMALGKVRASAADARAALAAASTNTQRALSRLALGLALERAGDLPSALREIRLARLTQPDLADDGMGEVPGLFVFRPADAKYLAGLDAMVTARVADEPSEAALAYERATVAFQHYAALVPSEDRWVAVARVHAAECERAHVSLAREAKPPPAAKESSGGFF